MCRGSLISTSSVGCKSQASLPTLRRLYGKKSLRSYLDRVSLTTCPITRLKVDAIVNSARADLLGSDKGTVDYEIHQAAGPLLMEGCKKLGSCAVGDAKLTDSYKLPSKCIIHAVGPVYNNTAENERLLAACYRRSLRIAAWKDLKTVAFSLIAVGGQNDYPLEEAVRIALDTVRRFLSTEDGDKIELVAFVSRKDAEKRVLRRLVPEYFPNP